MGQTLKGHLFLCVSAQGVEEIACGGSSWSENDGLQLFQQLQPEIVALDRAAKKLAGAPKEDAGHHGESECGPRR